MSIDPAARIHPLALVDGDDVTIGSGTSVWQFASVIRGARIGADCRIASNALVDGGVIGDRCKIGYCVAVAAGILLGNDVFVGPRALFCNDAWPGADRDGFDLEALRSGQTVVRVDDGAVICAGAIILPGVTIGAGAMVAAGVVVRRSVPAGYLFRRDGEIVGIDPARRRQRMKFAPM